MALHRRVFFKILKGKRFIEDMSDDESSKLEPPPRAGGFDSDRTNQSAPVERFDLRILTSLRRIVRASDLYSRKLESQYKITLPQLVCLLAVADEGPFTTSQLARRVFLSASTVVGILDRLEERGFIYRERDAGDRRLVRVATTDSGKALAGQAPSPLQDGLANALKNLPELEQATIALSLERIVGLMEAGQLGEHENQGAAESQARFAET